MKKTLLLTLSLFGWMLCGQIFAQQKINYSVDNCVVPFDKGKIKPTKSGYAFWYLPKEFTKSGFNVKLSYVDQATATHPPHQHPNDECYFILEGTAIVTIADKEIKAKPSSCVYCPGGVLHGIKRAGKKPIKYLVINN